MTELIKMAKPKKRGVKPGTKRGPYKKKGRKKQLKITAVHSSEGWKVGDAVSLGKSLEEMATKKYDPAPMTLCGQLEDAILLLENRISNAIAKINSLM